jgi:hypothetical protein
LLEGLQGFPTLKQIISLNIGLKRIIIDYNQGHIIRELRNRDVCSNRLHVDILRFSFIKLGYILYIPLK